MRRIGACAPWYARLLLKPIANPSRLECLALRHRIVALDRFHRFAFAAMPAEIAFIHSHVLLPFHHLFYDISLSALVGRLHMTDEEGKKERPSRYRRLKPWKAGAPSPNPGGRPRQLRETVEKLRENADEIATEILTIALKKGKRTVSNKIHAQRSTFKSSLILGTACSAAQLKLCWSKAASPAMALE
jgi:hypothetical protein